MIKKININLVILVLLVSSIVVVFNSTKGTKAAVAIGNNTMRRWYSKSQPKNKKFVINGTSSLTSTQIYDKIRPATTAQSQDMANKWNSASSIEALVIDTYEDEACPWNPSYCSSIGKNYGSKVIRYSIVQPSGFSGDWIEY